MAKGLLPILLLFGTTALCQIGQPQPPQYQSFQPVPIGQSYSPQQQPTAYRPSNDNNPYAPQTTTAADIERMANRNSCVVLDAPSGHPELQINPVCDGIYLGKAIFQTQNPPYIKCGFVNTQPRIISLHTVRSVAPHG